MEITLESFLQWVDVAVDIGILMIVLLLIIVLLRVIRLLGIVNEIAEMIAEITEMVNTALWKPIQLYGAGMKFLKKLLSGK